MRHTAITHLVQAGGPAYRQAHRRAQNTIDGRTVFASERRTHAGGDALRFRFDRARLAARVEKDRFQFRDLRAKAGTDKTEASGDIRAAQLQLGHKSLKMTEHYVR
ncbi:tyrosine-type recombinase/integrase [Paraburkholderia sp. GAS348]|uniref:tyrosine-type recombinase/integrase n=1 Tax=Paraburkholderia sp. GAS348 TaxID=3035132 RepID=UPI003D20F4CA